MHRSREHNRDATYLRIYTRVAMDISQRPLMDRRSNIRRARCSLFSVSICSLAHSRIEHLSLSATYLCQCALRHRRDGWAWSSLHSNSMPAERVYIGSIEHVLHARLLRLLATCQQPLMDMDARTLVMFRRWRLVYRAGAEVGLFSLFFLEGFGLLYCTYI